MSRKTLLGAAAVVTTTVAVVAGSTGPAMADVPDHHHIICDSASFYRHYSVGSGPFDKIRTLYRDNQVGHTYGSGEGEINGWIYALDFGPNDWGWVLRSCVSG